MKNFTLVLVSLLLLLISSCKKQSSDNIDSAQDNAAFETEYAQIYDVVSDFASTDSHTGKTDDFILPNGARVIFTDSLLSDGDGLVFTIDYGLLDHGGSTKGIPCRDGRYRAGKIHVAMTDRWSNVPCVVNITITTADNYYVGNGSTMYQFSGLKTITRSSATAYTVEVTNATLQRDNGTATWSCNRTVAITYNAPGGVWDDEFEMIGTASGTNKNGMAFTVETLSPLKKIVSLSCLTTFVKGKWQLNSGDNTITVDYDPDNNEQCDKKVAVTVNGRTRTVEVW